MSSDPPVIFNPFKTPAVGRNSRCRSAKVAVPPTLRTGGSPLK